MDAIGAADAALGGALAQATRKNAHSITAIRAHRTRGQLALARPARNACAIHRSYIVFIQVSSAGAQVPMQENVTRSYTRRFPRHDAAHHAAKPQTRPPHPKRMPTYNVATPTNATRRDFHR